VHTGPTMSPAHVFLGLNGRIARRTWWLYGVLALIGLHLLGVTLLRIAGLAADLAHVTMNVVLLWPGIAVSVKRWHDRGKSGWWVLINLVPFVGWIWALVENGFLRGSAGANRFGPAPDPSIASGDAGHAQVDVRTPGDKAPL
jgi:uncharacterized membrane protein YhaH (DUF805 family)